MAYNTNTTDIQYRTSNYSHAAGQELAATATIIKENSLCTAEWLH